MPDGCLAYTASNISVQAVRKLHLMLNKHLSLIFDRLIIVSSAIHILRPWWLPDTTVKLASIVIPSNCQHLWGKSDLNTDSHDRTMQSQVNVSDLL